jgi:hypothetical protein
MSNELTIYKNKDHANFLNIFYEDIFNNYINYHYKKNELLIKLLGVYLFRKFFLFYIRVMVT